MFFGKRYLFSGKMISPYAFILARRERWFLSTSRFNAMR